MKQTYYPYGPYLFTGLTTSEVYLVKIECLIKRNKIGSAMDMLKIMWGFRYQKENPLPEIHAQNEEDALILLFEERRKELVFRGLRWYDLRRINKDIRFAQKLIRWYEEKQYNLQPNSELYKFPIPLDENNKTSEQGR